MTDSLEFLLNTILSLFKAQNFVFTTEPVFSGGRANFLLYCICSEMQIFAVCLTPYLAPKNISLKLFIHIISYEYFSNRSVMWTLRKVADRRKCLNCETPA